MIIPFFLKNMKKKFIVLILVCITVVLNPIGVRQLQEFNDAKKEVEKIVRLSGPLSDEIYKKFEKNIAIVESVDKKAADDFRTQIATKRADIILDVGDSERNEPVIQESVFEVPKKSQEPIKEKEKVKESVEKIVQEGPERLEFESDVPLSIEIQEETPVISVTSPWTAPVVRSQPESRQTPVISTQASWDVPVPKKQQEQKKEQEKIKITQNVNKVETAVDQAEKNLNTLIIDQNYVFQEKYADFSNWNNAIKNYSSELSNLKNVDRSLYDQKIIKVQRIETLFAQKLVDYVSKNIQFFREKIEAQLSILKKNEETKKIKMLILSDTSEFNKRSYEYFFGDISKGLWDVPITRRNLSWFKEGHQQLMNTYFNKGIKPFSDLLFKYHNTKSSTSNMKNIIGQQMSHELKAKIDGLKEDINEYKKLLSNAYNGMFEVQKLLSPDDIKRQKVLIENTQKNNYLNYERHIKFLDEADKTITNQFWKRLWPESSQSFI